MQRIVFAFICIVPCFSAIAGVKLPNVNITDNGISARAVFGEQIVDNKVVNKNPPKIENTKNNKIANIVSTDNNADINIVNNISNQDILMPKKPKSDLWATVDTPLRMPKIEEINIVKDGFGLPEETLNIENKKVIARSNATKLDKIQDIAQNIDVEPKTNDVIKIRREIVPMVDFAKNNTTDIKNPKFAVVSDMSKMSPNELKKAFKKTYLSENKHLSTYQIDDRYDVASDVTTNIEGFIAKRDLSENTGGVRPLEIKISFGNNDSALSRDNYTLLSEYASIVVNNPKRAIQVAIPETATRDNDNRKLAARRLAIVEQVLRDTGVAEQRIVPVLSQRNDDSFALRIISNDQYDTLTQQKRNMFGDNVSKKTYKSMSW